CAREAFYGNYVLDYW
nr:immunoglobulin heavy chain junction region [Mus musculus]